MSRCIWRVIFAAIFALLTSVGKFSPPKIEGAGAQLPYSNSSPLPEGRQAERSSSQRGGREEVFVLQVEAASGTSTMKLKDIAIGKVIQVGNSKFVKVMADLYMAVNPLSCSDPTLTSANAYKSAIFLTSLIAPSKQTFS